MTIAESPASASDVDLDDVLGPPITDDELESEPPRVQDQLVINRRLKRMMKLDAMREEKELIALNNKVQIELWLGRELAKIGRERSWCERQVESFMRWHGGANRVKSLRLPHGVLSLRSARPKIDVYDPEAFSEWAFSNAPHLVRVKIEPDKTELAKLSDHPSGKGLAITRSHHDGSPIRDDGGELAAVVVPGVQRIVPNEDSFSIKLGGDNE